MVEIDLSKLRFKKSCDDEISLKKHFWFFISNLYGNTIIEEACRMLQNKYQLNVNLILFCCWLADQNFQCLTDSQIQLLLDVVRPWHEKIVNGLRDLFQYFPRKTSNQDIVRLKDLVADNEKFADKIEQSLMFKLSQSFEKQSKSEGTKVNQALTNIFNYIKMASITIHQVDLEKIYRVVRECFRE